MRRGQQRSERTDPENGFTKQELLEASGLSSKSFDNIRKAARVRGPNHGGLNWVFSLDDVVSFIHRAESGNFTERGAPAAKLLREYLGERGIRVPEK